MRKAVYIGIYIGVYFLRKHLSMAEFLGLLAVVTVVLLGVHFHLKKGDAEILKKVKASQDRYEYEQEKKADAARAARKRKPEGIYRE